MKYSDLVKEFLKPFRPRPPVSGKLAHMNPYHSFAYMEEREDKERECTISYARAILVEKSGFDVREIVGPKIH